MEAVQQRRRPLRSEDKRRMPALDLKEPDSTACCCLSCPVPGDVRQFLAS
jgi:hypothetical protein